MRIALIVAVAMAAAPAGAADKPRITSITITPAEPLAPHPRPRVDTAPLDVPPGPPSMVVAAAPPAPDRMLGRWTERDARFCQDEQYVIEWQPARLRVVLDGGAIDGGAVRYVVDGATLRIERLTDAGEVDAYWRVIGVDDDHVEWVETAERRNGELAVIAKPDKLFVRCPANATPAPGFMTRARRWWASVVARWWPSAPGPTS
jgi:hypothetical protein